MYKLDPPLWPYPTLGESYLNKIESNLPEDFPLFDQTVFEKIFILSRYIPMS